MKWVGGMDSEVDPELIAIYNRAVICKTFPAYTLQSLKDTPARDVLIAMELLSTAAKVNQDG